MTTPSKNTPKLKSGLAQMLKGGVIMDVVTPEQAVIAEKAGAVSVMALERVPSDIRKDGGVARMSAPEMIKGIIKVSSIPVMAKVRIGHFVEAQILEALGVDYIDESEVLTPADEFFHVDKSAFKVPFVCGARNLGEALRRIQEGAAMIRTKGEAGTGNVVEAVRHMRQMQSDMAEIAVLWEMATGKKSKIHALEALKPEQFRVVPEVKARLPLKKLTSKKAKEMLKIKAKEMRVTLELVEWVGENGKLPVVNFAAGGIATPADAALMMQLGAEGVFVGSGIFKSADPALRASAIVKATLHFNDPKVIAEVSEDLGASMDSLEMSKLTQKFAERGW